jgi:hypothetical protein
MIVLVTGGHSFSDRDKFNDVMDSIHRAQPLEAVIHGAASGADTLANLWAFSRGVQPVACPALWDYHGKRAGGKRNRAMLLLRPDLVIAFPGGRGTNDMVNTAREQLFRVFDYRHLDLV